MLRIISWNIRQGGGSRIPKIISAIRKIDAQIITLNEYRNSKSGARLRAELLNLGYRYQFVTHSRTSANSVIIASKIPCDSSLYPKSDTEFGGNILSVSFEVFDFYGVYFPHKKKHNLFNFLLEHLPIQKPSIIAGDYNSGINAMDQKGNSFWYEDELKALNTIDYIDAFRLKNGTKKEYSWFSHKGNGYRYDHTYIHEDLSPVVSKCYYNHQVCQDGISDHSMMVLELSS